MRMTSCSRRTDYEAFLQLSEQASAREVEQYIAERHHDDAEWYLVGYCRACEGPAKFLVDRLWGGQEVRGIWIPAWRERMECVECHLNNRQRLIAGHFRAALRACGPGARAYMTEAITHFGQWAGEALDEYEVSGRESLPDEAARGYLPEEWKDTRHEDVTQLTFDDGCLDVIVSNDVLEHVPQPTTSFQEMARVLRTGGALILTVPMDVTADRSVVRARMEKGRVHHLLDPVYHGNPVDAEQGSLVFTDFGWDIVHQLLGAGFATCSVDVGWSALYGHLGPPQVVVLATR